MTGSEQGVCTLFYPTGMLNLEYTLSNGQMFRWRRAGDAWWEAITGPTLIRIRQAGREGDRGDRFEFYIWPAERGEAFVSRFFRLDVDLPALYGSWRAADPYLGSLTERFAGLRLVLQEPEECLLSFICSTANFIPRIMRAVSVLAHEWGQPITTPDGRVLAHAFPGAAVLAELDPEEVAAKTGLEWRAGNLVRVARQLASRPPGWLEGLAKLDYPTARGELMRIEGVGPKIADCVCLFAFARDQAVPVDTHVWQLVRDRYLPALRGRSLTPSLYAQVLQFFQTRFEKPGWAQQYLFYDHLLESRARRGRREPV